VGTLIYATNTSLDGYIEDANGSFDWSTPDQEVHEFYNGLMADIDVQVLGRRLYQTMAVWETDPTLAAGSPTLAGFATAWVDSDKLVVSSSLAEPVTSRTQILSTFDADRIAEVKDATPGHLLIGGAELAGHAFRAGLIDQVQLMISPVAVGAGKPALPTDLRVHLELIEERRFPSGTVRLAYRVRR
jgi:dihydrofolate reductase